MRRKNEYPLPSEFFASARRTAGLRESSGQVRRKTRGRALRSINTERPYDCSVARAFVFATVVNKIRRPYRGLFITVPHGQSFEIMKTSVPRRIVGCIGKCTSGLTPEELDHVTDHIHKTLTHPKGRKMFKEYLKQAHRKDDLACLKFYEKCSEFIEKEENYHRSVENPTLDFLTEDVNEAMTMAEDLDGVPEIDMAILERFNETLTRPCRESMLSVLEETKLRLMNHLRNAHRGFKTYALAPCPRTK